YKQARRQPVRQPAKAASLIARRAQRVVKATTTTQTKMTTKTMRMIAVAVAVVSRRARQRRDL
ncbi:hypothetical protein H4S03_009446, partial [Coemansia sp. S3946]